LSLNHIFEPYAVLYVFSHFSQLLGYSRIVCRYPFVRRQFTDSGVLDDGIYVVGITSKNKVSDFRFLLRHETKT